MLQVVKAFDRQLIEEISLDGLDALNAKLAAAARVFSDRKNWLPPYQRLDILHRLAGLLLERREHFAKLIALEGGKPLVDAIVEITRAVDGINCAISEMRNLHGREVPMGLTAASTHRTAWTVREPIGIVAAISAFNHPLNLIVHQVVPAIAIGCPIIIKPSTTTPLSCRDFLALVHKAGLPEGWCQIFLPEDNALAEALATDPRVSFLNFIGSARVGWHLHHRLAPGTRAALEHGGAAPAIVDRSAALDTIIEPITKGGYYHAGQVCVSTQRIFVHQSVKEKFVGRLAERVAKLRVGDPLSMDTEVGPLITPKEVDRVAQWVSEAAQAGATIATGGRKLGLTTYAPTVLVDPPLDAKVSTLEIFGPVTCVYGYDDLDGAIRIANSLPMAFQASVFAQDIDVALYAAQQLDASAVLINDHTAFRTDWMPFAGRRQSGYGVGGIVSTMGELTLEKMIVFSRKQHF